MKRWNRAIRCLPAPPRRRRRGEERRARLARLAACRIDACTGVGTQLRVGVHVCTWDTNQPTLHLPSPTRQSRSAYWLRGRTLANLSVGRKQHASVTVRDNGKAGKPDFVQSMSTADGLIRLYIFPSSPLFSFAFLFILVPFRCSLLVRCHPLIARACLGLPLSLARGDSTGSPRKKSIRRAANCSRDRPFFPKVRLAVVFDLLFPNPILLFPPFVN